jgi:DNA replication and repair protein RecF
MLLSHLSLTHFRNYRHLELDFSRRLMLLQGRNAQGKTSLLEAIYFLATSKPIHASTEREVVDWGAQEEPIPYSRVAATIHESDGAFLDGDGNDHGDDHGDGSGSHRTSRPIDLEILLTPRGDGLNFNKQVRINGANKRSLELIGMLRAVLFLPEDIKLVDGAPGERRRYMDIALCQIDPVYTRTLSAYQKVLAQRNSLLKNLREQGARASNGSVDAQLSFWDEQLIETGSWVVARRHNFVAQLQPVAQMRHAELSEGREQLMVEFLPSFNYGPWPEAEFDLWQEGYLLEDRAWPWSSELAAPDAGVEVSVEQVAVVLREQLMAQRSRELAAGMTLYGPHRDDLRFLANQRDLRVYGSRGQQRSAALSLKLAEVQVMSDSTGTAPLLLLDDVMSELDAQRRNMLLSVLNGVEQAVITTTDWEDFAPEFRQQAQCLHVCDGALTPVDGAAE